MNSIEVKSALARLESVERLLDSTDVESSTRMRHSQLVRRLIVSIEYEIQALERKKFQSGSNSSLRRRLRFLHNKRLSCLKLL